MEKVTHYAQKPGGVHIEGEWEGNYINGDFYYLGPEQENIDGSDTVHLYKYASSEYGLIAIFKVFPPVLLAKAIAFLTCSKNKSHIKVNGATWFLQNLFRGML